MEIETSQHMIPPEGRLPIRVRTMEDAVRGVVDDAIGRDSEGDAFRLLFLQRGSAIVCVNGRTLSLASPCCLCLNEREAARLQKSGTTKGLEISFHPAIINQAFTFDALRGDQAAFDSNAILDMFWLQAFLNRSEGFTGHIALSPSSSLRIDSVIARIRAELECRQDGYWPCRTRSFLFELLHLLNGLARDTAPWRTEIVDATDELALSVMRYLDERFNERMTISDLTRRFNTNRTTLSRRFLAATGTTIMEYLARTRIRLSYAMLRDTSLPVSEIMERVGINDATRFARLFKRETGMSPSRYRSSIGR